MNTDRRGFLQTALAAIGGLTLAEKQVPAPPVLTNVAKVGESMKIEPATKPKDSAAGCDEWETRRVVVHDSVGLPTGEFVFYRLPRNRLREIVSYDENGEIDERAWYYD